MIVTLAVNGVTARLEVAAHVLLAHLLRAEFGLTSVHVGCDTSICGACTVLLDGAAVKSCTVLAVQADGGAVTTLEGLGREGSPTAVQEAFRSEHALQCGYCTPGMVIAATALLETVPRPDDAAIRAGLEGNLCRCTGYVNIVRAVRRAAATLAGEAPSPVAGESLRDPLQKTERPAVAARGEDVEVV